VRTKAQEMLVSKDHEISKLRAKNGKKDDPNKEEAPGGNQDVTITTMDANSENSGIESDSSDEENGRSKERNRLDG